MTKRSMKADFLKFAEIIVLTVLFVLVSGCDTKEESLGGEEEGRVITQTYISNANVCLDINMNFRCEKSERTVATDASGFFSVTALSLTEDEIEKYQLVAELHSESEYVGYGRKTGGNVLSSIPGHPGFITPLTTIIAVETGRTGGTSIEEAENKFKEAFGLPNYTYFKSDYVVEENDTLNTIASFISAHQKENLADVYNDEEITSLRSHLEQLNDDIFENAQVIQALSSTPEDNTRQGKGQVNLDPKVLSNLPFTQGMDFGVGYDKLTSNILTASQCIESNLEPYKDSTGRLPASFYEDKINIGRMVVQRTAERNEVDYFFQVVESKQDLYDMFSLDASIDLNIGEFAGSLQGSYAKEMENDQSSVYVLIKVDAKLADFKIVNPTLTTEAVDYFLCNSTHLKGCVDNDYTQGYNPENFRKKCGDYFLNVITVGGSYYAMLKIKTNSLQEKKEISGKLQASYKSKESGTTGNVSGEFSYVIDNLTENYNATIHTITKGVPGSLSAVKSKDDLMKDIDAFFKNLSENAGYPQVSFDDEKTEEKETTPFVPSIDYRKAVFEVKFEDYEQSFMDNIKGGADEITVDALKKVALDKEIKDTIIELYSRYEHAETTIRFMLAFPESFIGVIERDKELGEMLKKLRAFKSITKFFAYECTKTVGRSCKLITQSACDDATTEAGTCTDNEEIVPELYSVANVLWFKDECDVDKPQMCLERPETIVNSLPAERIVYPATCVQRKKLYATNDKSGIYTLFMSSDKEKPYLIYCDDMDVSEEECNPTGSEDSEESPTQADYDINCGPKEYLILSNISPQPGSTADPTLFTPSYNFSRYVGYSGDDGSGLETMLTSVYYKLRVLVNRSHLAVVPDQEMFVSTIGDMPEGIDGSTARYGSTSACSLNKEWSAKAGGVQGYLTRISANISLEGTPFYLPDDLTFITNKQFDVVNTAASHDAAYKNAVSKGGYLPVVQDEEDNNKFKSIINTLGMKGSWMGLKSEGTKALIEVFVAEKDDKDCQEGENKIIKGIDKNSNGKLDNLEIQSVVCTAEAVGEIDAATDCGVEGGKKRTVGASEIKLCNTSFQTGFKGFHWLDTTIPFNESHNYFVYDDDASRNKDENELMCGFMSGHPRSYPLINAGGTDFEDVATTVDKNWFEFPCSGEITAASGTQVYEYPYIIEYLSLSTEIEDIDYKFTPDGSTTEKTLRQGVNLKISNKLDNGKCGYLRPAYDLILEYDKDLADHLGIIEKAEIPGE
ncbi:MAG: hypothetical protein RBT87_08715 [bacterium]|nr:hypothetical protein [bacterium]